MNFYSTYNILEENMKSLLKDKIVCSGFLRRICFCFQTTRCVSNAPSSGNTQ